MSRERVCRLDELVLGKGREFVVAGRVLAVFRLETGVSIIEGICPHAGGPLAQGYVRGDVVTCPWHGWQFSVSTGQHQLNPRMCVPTFPATVDGDDVYVEIPA
ncbi:MAG TPA: Rieske 2Fe-2S domain-containing protein [Planctomycetaceae bacterium]|nr:Rieske 2Fe-2S domain-containing protein [Planctomycetaceae bacterium]